MDDDRFDAFARLLGSGRSRRHALKTLGGGIVGGLGALVGRDAAAVTCQEGRHGER